MDETQNPLCHVYLEAKQNVVGNLLSVAPGFWAGREMSHIYIVQDEHNQNALIVKKDTGAWSVNFGILDACSKSRWP